MVGIPTDSTFHVMDLNYITYIYLRTTLRVGKPNYFYQFKNREQSHILHTGPLSPECKHFWHLCFPATLPTPSPPPRCLFIRQTICRKLCVFPRRCAPSARWRSAPNYLARAGSPAWAAAQRAEMKPACVFTPGSLSARLRVMGESGGEFSPSASPHYSSLQAD